MHALTCSQLGTIQICPLAVEGAIDTIIYGIVQDPQHCTIDNRVVYSTRRTFISLLSSLESIKYTFATSLSIVANEL